jgi:MoxR-like ATPase
MAKVNPPFTWKFATPPPIRPDMMKGIDNGPEDKVEHTEGTDAIETGTDGSATGEPEDNSGTDEGIEPDDTDSEGVLDGEDMPNPSGDPGENTDSQETKTPDREDEEANPDNGEGDSTEDEPDDSQQGDDSDTEGQCQGKLCELVQQHDEMIGEQAKIMLSLKQETSANTATMKSHDRVLKEHHDRFQSVNAGMAKLSDRLDSSGKWANTVNEKLLSLNEAIKLRQNIVRIELTKDDEVVKAVEGQHFMFDVLLRTVMTGKFVWLVGPAGSFKTVSAKMVADTLDLPFYCTSVSSQTSVTALVGYMDAGGTYRPSAFRNAYEFGGVFLLDEVDAGNPNVLTALNSSENTFYSFPDQMVQRHPAFRLIAAGNTYGTGASRQHVGRNQLDEATLNRYVFIEWPYDNEMEMNLATNKEWCKLVQHVRKEVDNMGMQIIISPRTTLMGEALLKKGIKQKDVVNMVIIKGSNADTKAKIERVINDYNRQLK